MALRIGFDMDGVLADFARAYREIEERVFGPVAAATRPGDPEDQEAAETTDEGGAAAADPVAAGHALRRRRDTVWQTIEATPNFWTTLQPLDTGAVRRIHELSVREGWDVFFITQRPATDGETVQRQTQRWLVEQGFELPSVLVIHGSRGEAARALRLDYLVDDSARNCIDVKAMGDTKALLVTDPADESTAESARRLGIGTVSSIGEALDLIEQASLAKTQPNLLTRIAKLVGLD
jgi:phosphoglycolate phosphatase-like HAD superfamily hydrolase